VSENQSEIECWNGRAGREWAAWQEELDAWMAPITEVLLERAAPKRGERVIDVGCGAGTTTLALGERVGESGHVTGVDVSQQMLARARERASNAPWIELLLGDAASTALPRADLVVSRFGVMFFVDPVRAFRNLRGERLTFACWRPMKDNPWARVPAEAVAPFTPPAPPPTPESPGPFSFADPDRVQRILDQAGWKDITIEPVDLSTRWGRGGTLASAFEMVTHVGPASRRLAEASDPTPGRAALREALKPFVKSDGVWVDAAIWIVRARG
jgi:SAM-dependent methyltransferase